MDYCLKFHYEDKISKLEDRAAATPLCTLQFFLGVVFAYQNSHNVGLEAPSFENTAWKLTSSFAPHLFMRICLGGCPKAT